MTGDVYEVALKGLRRAIYFHCLPLNLFSVVG